ncbi:hypothetical protein A3SI_12799 [Nitritalea halalkaliphila LW7]|uniref:ABC transporter permease n=1 Tax=Nitritalea halalkaliphila LW7 TaxID=1189621 RepID=I5C1L7_9BACT|nr:hypothetical protein [Nitritalea halalkaliphila]EIM75719.1 hypothetical protein A3SI_12799 [Nitritalea halalkaliphila LW7]
MSTGTTLQRFFALLRFDISRNTRAYMVLLPGFVLFLCVLQLLFWFGETNFNPVSTTYAGTSLNKQLYFPTYLIGFIGLVLFVTSNSFSYLHKKDLAIQHLLLPATRQEKFFYEFFIRVIAVVVVYHLAFPLIAMLAHALYLALSLLLFGPGGAAPETIWQAFSRQGPENEKPEFAFILSSAVFCLFLLPISALFLGGLYFKKLNWLITYLILQLGVILIGLAIGSSPISSQVFLIMCWWPRITRTAFWTVVCLGCCG